MDNIKDYIEILKVIYKIIQRELYKEDNIK